MGEPRRIQQRRTKGWRKPAGAISVARPSKWGNPYVVHNHTMACYDDGSVAYFRCPASEAVDNRAVAVKRFRHLYLFPCTGDPQVPSVDEIRVALAGHDLMCWCPLDQPCHADVLLEIANSAGLA